MNNAIQYIPEYPGYLENIIPRIKETSNNNNKLKITQISQIV
jgi:hypothetical protein